MWMVLGWRSMHGLNWIDLLWYYGCRWHYGILLDWEIWGLDFCHFVLMVFAIICPIGFVYLLWWWCHFSLCKGHTWWIWWCNHHRIVDLCWRVILIWDGQTSVLSELFFFRGMDVDEPTWCGSLWWRCYLAIWLVDHLWFFVGWCNVFCLFSWDSGVMLQSLLLLILLVYMLVGIL